MPLFQTPGVYKQEVFPAPTDGLRTGVPVFVGLVAKSVADGLGDGVSLMPTSTAGLWLLRTAASAPYSDAPEGFGVPSQFENCYGVLAAQGYLVRAVRGFFENGGRSCYVQVVCFDAVVAAATAFGAGLETLTSLDNVDLVAAPDIMWPQHASERSMELDEDRVVGMQLAMLEHCDTTGDRLAIIDSLPGVSAEKAGEQRAGLTGDNGALYYPWVLVGAPGGGNAEFMPPSGHVCGIHAKTDHRVGVHKAPANEELRGVLDLEVHVTPEEQGRLNPEGVNCLRSFPGRGIRVWGARTLSRDPSWVYVNVRRLFLTAARWIERSMVATAFEPNDARLWARICRQLSAYFTGLYEQGALKGRSAAEAFYVKCDGETNPPEVIDLGQVVVEIGLAAAVPNEFVVVRIVQDAAGISIAAPA